MNIKELEVVDVIGAKTGKTIKVDLDNAQIRSYNNKKNEAIYSTVDLDGKLPVDVIVNKQITDIEERLSTWNNPVRANYAVNMIQGNKEKNDPESKIWNSIVEYVKNNQNEFFTKNGDWKQRVQAAKNRMEIEVVKNV